MRANQVTLRAIEAYKEAERWRVKSELADRQLQELASDPNVNQDEFFAATNEIDGKVAKFYADIQDRDLAQQTIVTYLASRTPGLELET